MSTFDKVADIIAETSEIPREDIKPESHTIDDLGIDSLDFLDIVFRLEKKFDIKLSDEEASPLDEAPGSDEDDRPSPIT